MSRIKNRHTNYKNDKGAISLFVVLAMLFFLVFVVGSYTMISRKNQQQAESNAELKSAYIRNGEEQYDAIASTGGTIIPIRNKQDYYKIATGAEILDTTTGFSYKATPEATYSIKSTITIPIEEISGFKGDLTDDYRFKDYLVYNDFDATTNDDGYNVNCEPGVDIVYSYGGENYKLLVYSKTGKIFTDDNLESSTDEEFCMYKKTADYSAEPHEFILYISNDSGTFEDIKIDDEESGNAFTTSIYGELPVLSSLISNLMDGEDVTGRKYFLFVKYEKSSDVIGNYLSNIVNVGDYVNYRLDYSSLVDDSDAKGWRVISKEYDESKNSYIIKLISEGAPIKYTCPGETSFDITAFDKAMYDNFEKTEFTAVKDDKKVTGAFFKNAYADNVQGLNYQIVSTVITENSEVDYITKQGGIDKTDLRESTKYAYDTNYYRANKNGLLNIGKSYWIGKVSTDTKNIYYANYINDSSTIKISKWKNDVTSTYYVRPVVTLIDNLIIVANDDGSVGTGTKENPYNIKTSNKYVSGPSVGDYVVYSSTTGEKRYEYENVTVARNNGITNTSNMEGWRILDIADDGTIRLISAGVPYTYDLINRKANPNRLKTVEEIKNELVDNFETTDFNSSGAAIKGDFLLNTEYASEISTLSYEDLSKLVYNNSDYITVSENKNWGLGNNTLNDTEFKYVINDWNTRKYNLINVGSDYMVTTNDTYRAVVYNQGEKQGCLVSENNASSWEKIGIRVVVTLKKTTKFLTGTGTKTDPYVLSANVSSEMAPFRVGDYVTYSGIAQYTNVSNLTDSNGKSVTQTGWRVLSYKKNGSSYELKLISAGIPYSTTAFNLTGVTGKEYAENIKNINYNTIDFHDAAGNKLTDENSLMKKDERIEKVEAVDYNQYCDLIKLYNNREVSKDLVYLNQYYWLGSYYEQENENKVKSYRLRYVTTSADSSLMEKKTYGVRTVITLKTGFNITEHSGTASDPHVLTYTK